MRNGRRWRLGALAAASLVGHVAVLSVLAVNHAKPARYEPAPVFEVTIAPRIVESVPQTSPRPRQQLRPRPSRLRPDDLSVTPLFVPEAPPPAAPAPTPPSLTPQLSATLRRSLGCANIGGSGLSQAERDACMERLGEGAKDAAYIPPGLSRPKQALLDEAAAKRKAYRDYRDAPTPPGLSTSDAAGGLTGLGEAAPHKTTKPF
ncbi:hypothetical protein [Phenylobacterium sp.]|uniref:hypothetical protein n=1 Tax=Phenylobacterium sp. TaxID=1871053 RepID=UPI003BAC68AD